MKEKLQYAALTLAFFAVACWRQGAAWLFFWPGLACALVLIGYLGAGAGILGKRADGSLPWWSWLLFGPYLAGYWVVNGLTGWWRRNIRGWADATIVAPGIVLSRVPDGGNLPPGVALVVDMTCEYAAPAWPREIRYETLPTLDNSVPPLEAMTNLLRRLKHEPGKILVHCAGGMGRSAMVVAALLVLRGVAPDAEAARDHLIERRPGVNFTREQFAWIVAAIRALSEPSTTPAAIDLPAEERVS